ALQGDAVAAVRRRARPGGAASLARARALAARRGRRRDRGLPSRTSGCVATGPARARGRAPEDGVRTVHRLPAALLRRSDVPRPSLVLRCLRALLAGGAALGPGVARDRRGDPALHG